MSTRRKYEYNGRRNTCGGREKKLDKIKQGIFKKKKGGRRGHAEIGVLQKDVRGKSYLMW